MKLKKILQFFCFLLAFSGTAFAQSGQTCVEGIIQAPGGADNIVNCQGDGLDNRVRFRTIPSGMPFAFLITDENNIILEVSTSNFINLEDLPAGSFRVWAFSYLGIITAEPGQDAANSELASICYQLTSNFIEISNVVPEAGTITTTEGANSVVTCPGDGNADLIGFSTTSTGPNTAYLITDENNIILAVTSDPEFDFEGAPEGICRVWSVAYAGNLIAEPGQDAATAPLSDECFDLSDDFIEVVRTVPDGGTVSLPNGETSDVTCEGDAANNILNFVADTDSPAPYAFVLTDENNIIIALLSGDSFDFNDIDPGTYRVWGLSYTGEITAGPGDDAAAIDLSDDCFDLSDNFVEVVRRDVDGAMVSLANGAGAINVCVNDGEADELTFVNTSDSQESYLYVITDENNMILNFSEDGMVDFEGAGVGVCRVWGLAYSGAILAEAGDDAAQVSFSDECFDLSDNFVEVNRKDMIGGTVSLAGGGNAVTVCVGDGQADVLEFTTDGSGDSYIFVITDENNIILGISEDGAADFDGAGAGVCRVWGLAFSGNLTAGPGDDAAAVSLSDECFELSENFISVTRRDLDAGLVSLEDGSDAAAVCAGDGQADELSFVTTITPEFNYTFVITDDSNIILGFSESGLIDFEDAGAGICRVWGLAYSGELLAMPGDDAAAVAFSDECFELSANFVTVDRTESVGGMVELSSGVTAVPVCVGDGFSDQLTAVTDGSGPNYVFLITDENNIILDLSEDGVVDFENAGPGTCRIWGLAYSGTLLAAPGQNAAAADLSDECFDLSDNFIEITRFFVDGGMVSLEDGSLSAVVCGNDDTPDILTFTGATTSTESYSFIVTDAQNNILTILTGNSIDFNLAAPGVCRLWGLSFTGDIIAEVGDNISSTDLTDGCYELSENFVQITREAVAGGTVSMPSGATLRYTCPGDGNPDVVAFINTGSSTDAYGYVITDENNNILSFTEADSFDFDGAPEGTCRVWGLAYSGDYIAMNGENAATATLTTECWDLSGNFIEVVREVPEGGMVAMPSGGTIRYTCPGDGNADVVLFDSTGTSAGPYVYVITDDANNILAISETDSNDFDGAPAGTCRVWGLAYTGTIIAEPGDNAATTDLTDDCWDLSDNYIEVIRDVPEGGQVSLSNGDTEEVTCPGDGEADVLQFDSINTSASNYIYVVTDTNNVILDLFEGDLFDFENAPEGICRVWGLSYTGSITADLGDTASMVELTDDCWDLSDNFVTVTRVMPQAGLISSNGGANELVLCVGDGTPDVVEFNVTGSSPGGYLFLVTDPDGFLVGSLDGPDFDFDNAVGGEFRVYGLAYTGNPVTIPGDNIFEVDLSTDCFDITESFIALTLTRIGGGELFTDIGGDPIYICPGDGIPDLVTFFSTSGANQAEYQFFITDEENNIISFLNGNQQDFDNTGFDVLRVWGVSYSGNFLATFGQDADEIEFSDECWDLSDTFITIVRDTPEGGEIATADGETSLLLCIGAVSGIVEFANNSTSQAGYVYLLTDTSNVIIDVSAGNTLDFNPLEADRLYRVHGLSYTGALLAEPGQDATQAMLSSSCFELSANFAEIYRSRALDGGELSALNGETTRYTCPGDGNADLVVVLSTSQDTGYQIVITNEFDAIVVPDVVGDVIDFDNADPGVYRIYGIAYFGTFTAGFGDVVNVDALADSCSAVSSNFITVFHEVPNGGKVTTDEGELEVTIVVGDGQPDSLTFVNEDASNSLYGYIVTDENDEILAVLDGDTNDFENAGPGNCKVWGVAYTGTLVAVPGMTVTTATLSDDCYSLSSNFVLLKRVEPFTEGEEGENLAPQAGNLASATIADLKVAPNPASDRISLSFRIAGPQNESSILQVFSTTGQRVFSLRLPTQAGNNQYDIDIHDLLPGLYILYMQNGQTTERIRLMKN